MKLYHASQTTPPAIAGLDDLWRETTGDPRIRVAILDGPVDNMHPSLASANLNQLATLVPGVADQGPASQHGTHIASIVFGQHDGPIKGIAPHCRGLIVPVFRDGPDGTISPCSQIDLARAITQAVQAGAHIINISGGEFTSSGTAHPLLADVVRNCAAKNVLIVAAAGNQGCDCLHIPGALPSVLAVGAMNAKGEPLEFSNWGESYKAHGILAPGEGILGAIPGGGTASNTGTSYATPIVSGIAALLLSLQIKRGEKPDAHVVRAALLDSAVGCDEQPALILPGHVLPGRDCRRLLAGRLNVKGATSRIITKGGNTMSESIETQENVQASEIEHAEAEAPTPGAQAATSGRMDPKVSENPPERPRAGIAEPREAENAAVRQAVVASNVNASACGCGGGASTQLVFAIGQLGYDFGTEARRDSIMQHMEPPAENMPPNPHDPNQLLAYLEKNPSDADAIIWTLNFDATPIYAIKPKDAFAFETYQRLRQFLQEQTAGEIERISLGGIIYASVRLLSGQMVPVICPNLRCMNSWNTAALIDAVSGASGASEETKKRKANNEKSEAVRNFLERVYHELRNLGTDPCHRAMNYSATNALNVANIFESALKDNMQLDTIACERTPICRPDSDCWDVKLNFFDPENQLTRARKVYRFTVDVSDICPVMVGPVRSWFIR
jgi:cyanobactin maturation PatA/PatG family protease